MPLRPAGLAEAMETADALVVSAASVWEAALKQRLGKLVLSGGPESLIEGLVARGAEILPISIAHAAHMLPDPPPTRDPFDRMLLAQCDVEGLRLLTADRALVEHRLSFRI